MKPVPCRHTEGDVRHVPFGGYELVCAKCQRRWLVSGCGADVADTTKFVTFSRPCPCGARAEGLVPSDVFENTVEVREKRL
jgi:hypothetical protein